MYREIRSYVNLRASALAASPADAANPRIAGFGDSDSIELAEVLPDLAFGPLSDSSVRWRSREDEDYSAFIGRNSS
jgi:hypothetical protein